MIDDGVFVGLVDLRDLIPPQPSDLVVAGLSTTWVEKTTSSALNGRAVGPAHAVAQMVGDRQSVFADAAVRLRRHLRCELRIRAVVLVPLDQLRHRHRRKVADVGDLAKMRIERVHVPRVREPSARVAASTH